MHFNLPVSPTTLNEISALDRFQGAWAAQPPISGDRLRRIQEAARIQSAAASCRLAGLRVTDAEVAGLLRDAAVPLADADEIVGYSRALDHLAANGELLLDGERLRQLHAAMVGGGEPASPWRRATLYREAFDPRGRATGQIFPTLPPRLVQEKTESLVTWLEIELRTGEQHPVLVIGAFGLCLLSIGPFERGNGRLSRLLTNLLLRRVGYGAIPYASLESVLEEMRDDYHAAVARSQTRLWTDEADLQPWLDLFLEALGRHRQRLETKMALERQVQDYPPLQRSILEAVREHGSVDAALLLQATGANRNTLKDNLRKLVQRGVLEKTGQRRGTRYHLSTGDRAEPGGGP